MLITFFSLIGGLLLIIGIIHFWIAQGQDRITEIYTCKCGSGSHYWISEHKLECNKCGLIKEVNHKGLIIT